MIVSFPAGDDSNNNNKVGLSSDDSEDDQHCPAQEPLRKKPKPMATRNWDDFFVALCQYKDQYGRKFNIVKWLLMGIQ